ncbi:MAG: hypothetical protein H7Y11_09735 [Armatimonadetes bacterium]|nr:hypothetical protein [Anaerolineae bacterium]
MQISRHWRLNAKRYRLEGIRYEDGAVSLQGRPVTMVKQEAVSLNSALTKIETQSRSAKVIVAA